MLADKKNRVTTDQLGKLLEDLDVASYYLSRDDLLKIFPNGRHVADKFEEYEGNLHKLYVKLDGDNREKMRLELRFLMDYVGNGWATSISHAIDLRRKAGWQ